MRTFIFSLGICFFPYLVNAQQSFIGIHTSARKGIVQALMNPAEINHLSKDVEVNLFSMGAIVSNNTVSFQDILTDDFLRTAIRRNDLPFNIRSEVQITGPSFGFKHKNWSIGLVSQVMIKTDILDLDPSLGKIFIDKNLIGGFEELKLEMPLHQRVNGASWTELGLMVGREVYTSDNHTIAAGGTFKVLTPILYSNIGLLNLQGNLIQNDRAFSLSNANGELNLNYPAGFGNENFVNQSRESFSLFNFSGVSMDLGFTHQWKNEEIVMSSSGISIRNIGGFNLGSEQFDTNFGVTIPKDESYRIDRLGGELEAVELQLRETGYFRQDSQQGKSYISLPTLISAYTDVYISRLFQVTFYGQYRTSNQRDNLQLITQNVFAITPRFTFGSLEIYSPWTTYEVSGITAGLGLRVGGFFIGSSSILTGLLVDTRQADFHMGFSMGFGRKPKPENLPQE